MPFSKEDLVCQHYHWNNNMNASIYTGRPSRRVFDRFNGEQVLFIINSYETLSGCTLAEALQIEDMIANQLPLEIKSEISVFHWLKDRKEATTFLQN
jgi:hypothetical protein